MHPFFASVDRYEVALLLTAMTVGGDEAEQKLSVLSEPLRGRLLECIGALRAMPEEMRKPLMTTEFKALLAQEGQAAALDWIDSTWLLHALRGEPPRIVAIVLLGLQAGPMNALLKRLPHTIRRQLPPKQELSEVDPKLLADLRLLFLRRFAPMPEPAVGPTRSFEDVLFWLERDELFRLIRDLGLTELGQAFAVVEKMALLELCRRLGKAQAFELLHAVKSASRVDQPDAKTAQHFLSKIVVNFDEVEEFLQKSGLWRLARCTYQLDPAWLSALQQRLPRQAGHQFGELCTRAQETLGEQQDDDVRLRLRDAILLRVIQLVRAGTIQPSWQESQIQFNDPEACQAILDAPPEGSAPASS